jgi:YbbR domain-containing protein
LRLIDGEKPGKGVLVRLKRTGEAGHIVHVFSVHPFKGDVVVLVGERRELCSVEEVDKIET